MAGTTDPSVAHLIARQQVIEAIDELFLATDRRDWTAVRAVLASTVRFDMSSVGGGPEAMRSAEEIAAGWEQGLAPIHAIHHQAGNYRVTVDGARAEAFCYGIAYHYLPRKTGGSTRVFVGSYDFELEHDGSRWRITAFRFNLKFVDGNLGLEAPDSA